MADLLAECVLRSMLIISMMLSRSMFDDDDGGDRLAMLRTAVPSEQLTKAASSSTRATVGPILKQACII